MSLTILRDADVKSLLDELTRPDVEDLQRALREALHEYSTGTQDDSACSDNQPMRTSLTGKSGDTTLFMPSISGEGIGLKGMFQSSAAPSKEMPLGHQSHPM